MASTLAKALPKPRYTGEHEEAQQSTSSSRVPRIISADDASQQQLVRREAGPPPYGRRAGWRPRAPEDYGDGGAFPEIPVAQYPLDMGRKGGQQKSNALAVQVDSEGKVRYDALVRQGHGEGRTIHSSFKDLIPLRQQANMGEISLDRPSEEQVAESKRKTEEALAKLTNSALAAQKPKNSIAGALGKREATYVRYTPASNQMGQKGKGGDRIMKIVQKQLDPMEPPKFKHKKIPRGPPSPPAPVMHSPPRKLTAEDQENWKIPPPISNWKNPKGYTIALDKRLAADGRGLQDVSINDKFAQFSEALFTADRHAREEVRSRAQMQQRIAEREKEEKEERLREMAQKAREEAKAFAASRRSETPPRRRRRSSSYDSRDSRARSRTRSVSSYSSSRSRSRSVSDDEGRAAEKARRDRERRRQEQRQQNEKEFRQSRMGAERKMKAMARDSGRDISEKVALGLAKPTASAESMYDSRLFNQSSGFDTGFNEDQHYDKPLFAAQDTINSIYRPKVNADEDDDPEAGAQEMERIQKQNRFEVLGKAQKGFRGADIAEDRAGPVQFERDTDPFAIDDLIKEASGGAAGSSGQKRYGMDEGDDRASKRARVDDE